MAKKKVIAPRVSFSGMSLESKVEFMNKKYGLYTLVPASKAAIVKRMRTGVDILDLTLQGGFPKNRIVELRGPYSALKTTLCYMTIKNFLLEHPEGEAYLVDLEKTHDPKYAERLGIPMDRFTIVLPDSGEQAIDIMNDLAESENDILLVLDSVAALVPKEEIESSVEKQFMGLHARLINKMVRVLTARMKQSLYTEDRGSVTLLAINQLREKIGVMFGDPETTPGGKGKDFFYSVILRVASSPSDRLMTKVTKHGIEREVRYGQNVKFRFIKNKTSSSQFEAGEFHYYTRPNGNYEAFSFNNDEVLFRYGVYYGIIKIKNIPKKGKVKATHAYEYGTMLYKKDKDFREALCSRPKTQRKIFAEILIAMEKEEEEALNPQVALDVDDDLDPELLDDVDQEDPEETGEVEEAEEVEEVVVEAPRRKLLRRK